jgi:hypothetical protein
MEKDEHNCIQENRLKTIEHYLKYESKQRQDLKQDHEDLKTAINGKLDKIWNTMNNNDNQIRSQLTSHIITLCIGFISAIIGALGVLLWLR